MKILEIEAGPVATNAYLCFDENAKTGFVIDAPPDSAETILGWVKDYDLKLEGILLTHTHWDHTGDAQIIADETGAKVYVHADDAYRLVNPMDHTIMPLPFELDPVKADVLLKDKEIIKTGDIELEVRHTPGHTEGGVCFVNHKNKLIFAGDTLFKASVGRIDLPGGSADKLIVSIQKQLLTLPGDYKVYSGHGPSTTIDWEKNNNPYLLHGLL